MAMQTDVKSAHAMTSKLVVNYRTRLKGAVVSSNAPFAARNTIFADNVPQTGTYNIPNTTTCTVTITNHGLSSDDRVWLNFTTGSGPDAAYTVTVLTDNTFTVTLDTPLTTNGNVTMYASVLMEADCYNPVAYSILVPGEGIIAEKGIYVGLPSDVTATVFYG